MTSTFPQKRERSKRGQIANGSWVRVKQAPEKSENEALYPPLNENREKRAKCLKEEKTRKVTTRGQKRSHQSKIQDKKGGCSLKALLGTRMNFTYRRYDAT